MPKIAYITRSFQDSTLEVIRNVDIIAGEYQAQGFTLTLRQIYYQFIARDLLPDSWADASTGTKNMQKNYKRLGDIINNARMAGLVDWDAIEDRGRSLISHSSWDSPADIIRSARLGYQMDLWRDQPYRPEVWIEKESLIGVIGGICTELRVPYYTTKGYNGQSEMWRAARRMDQTRRNGQTPIVFHFGDHDSSGLDMTRDNRDRLCLFMELGVQVERLALNMDQVEQYNPVPNPAKDTDSRYAEYYNLYGDESWELDALEPSVLSALIESAILPLRDEAIYLSVLDEEQDGRMRLRNVENRWEDIVHFLDDQ